MSIRVSILALMPVVLLVACDQESAPGVADAAASGDPLLARALNDPLMVDPDLTYSNEANAAITIRHDHALPPLGASDVTAQSAREAARRELLEEGPIVDLADPTNGNGPPSLAGARTANDMLATLGAYDDCAAGLSEGFAWAARLPKLASIMPHGMVRQAAGGDNNGCSVRVIRYVTPAKPEDALEYHYNRAGRGGLRVTRFSTPENSVRGSRGGTQMIVFARPAANSLSAVDLVYWQR